MRHCNIPIFIPHLGCPYECIYCNQKKISAQPKAPDDQEILHIIDQHLATIGRPAEIEAAFFGGSFTAIRPDLQENYFRLVQPYIEQNLIQGIRVSTRPDCIDNRVLELLHKYGVTTIELGVQSLNNEVLCQSGRIYKAEDVERSSALIKSSGFKLGIQLMVGLPGDNYDRDMETVRKTVAIAPQMVRIYPTLVITDTKLEQMWRKGKYQALTLEEAVFICRDMLLQFARADIPVIRLGLYPGEELCKKGTVLAGPFHPSFGELVEQAIFREQAIMAVRLYQQRYDHGDYLTLCVNERDLSKLLGKKRSNLISIQHSLSLQGLNILTCHNEERDWIGIVNNSAGTDKFVLTRAEFLHSLPETF
jgi:histone acetyltransferase (RNA polymerase elongator complex component)